MDLTAEIARHGAAQNVKPPRGLGQRYDAKAFLPEAGNTVVCALDTSHPAHAAVMVARQRVMALPGADKMLFTPATSLHMTVFEGAIETRRTPDAWPADLDLQAPVHEVTQALVTRLTGFLPPPSFRVRVSGIRPTGLILAGATAGDDAHLALWRDALTVPFGYRHRAHDAYRFHMTFCYPLEWFDPQEASLWHQGLADIMADLRRAAPVLPLRPPAFCQFADMTHFEELIVLAP